MSLRKGFPLWFNKDPGFNESDSQIVAKECHLISDYVPPTPPEVKEDHCLVLVAEGAENKLFGVAFCGPTAFEMYYGAVLLEFEGKIWLYEASREFTETHREK